MPRINKAALILLSVICFCYQASSECLAPCHSSFAPGINRYVAWNDTSSNAHANGDYVEVKVDASQNPLFFPASVQAAPGAVVRFLVDDDTRIYAWRNQDPCNADSASSPTYAPPDASGKLDILVRSSGPRYFSTSADYKRACARHFVLNSHSSLLGTAVVTSMLGTAVVTSMTSPTSATGGLSRALSSSFHHLPTGACWNRASTLLPGTAPAGNTAGTYKLPMVTTGPSALVTDGQANRLVITPAIDNQGTSVLAVVPGLGLVGVAMCIVAFA